MRPRGLISVFLVLSCSKQPVQTNTEGIPDAGQPVVVEAVPLEPENHLPVVTLGEYSTEYSCEGKDEARAKNIELAASRLQAWNENWNPGEEFSFNDAVGPRTSEAGFLNAPVIFMGETTAGIGGGVCQVSSTLHAAALMSGLEVITRRPHTRFSKYIPHGLDATVAYPPECNGNHRENIANGKNPKCDSVDLILRNPFGFEISIKTFTEESGLGKKRLRIWIEGAKNPIEKASYRIMQSGGVDFKRTFHKISRIRTATYKKLVQSGQQGAHVTSFISYLMKDGTKKEISYRSEYPPVNETWEVGLLYDMSGPPPWE